MPTSDPFNISPMMIVLTKLRPKRLLDIGCGFGKYGMLYREYTDIWDERLDPSTWQYHIEGVEAFPAYRNPIHDYAYDAVHYAPAEDVLPTLGEFDCVLISDVIEHLEHSAAKGLVAEAFRHAPTVVISTPRDFNEQHAICDNEYERHRCHFTAADYPEAVHVQTIGVMACDIFVGTRDPLLKGHFRPVDAADIVYVRSRRKLGKAGIPLSLVAKAVAKALG